MLNSKKITKESNLDTNFIPNYDYIFNETENVNKKKTRFVFKILKLNLPVLFLSLLIYIFQVAPVYLFPIVTANIIDLATQVINSGLTDSIIREFIINAIILSSAILLNIPSTMLRFRIVSKALRRNSAGIRSSVVRKLQSLSLTYFKKMESGRVQSKYLKDTDSVDNLFSLIMHNFTPAILETLIAIGISVYKNGYVSLFFLFVIPLNITTVFAFRKKVKNGFREFRLKSEDMSIKINTMVDMMPVTKSHGLEKVELKNVNSSITDYAKSGLIVDRTVAAFGSASWAINTLMKAITFFFCAFLAMKDIITVGEIVLYEAMFTQISANISNLINFMPSIGSGVEALNSISEIMNITDIEANIGKIEVPDIDGRVRFENVSYAYPDTDCLVVKDFSLDVKKGECIAVVGASGSGKSTLMNMIIGFLKPTKGRIFIDDKDIEELDLSKYRNKISVVPQSSILFSGSIKDNITYGMEKYTDEELQEVLEKANINEFLKDLSNGIETRIGEHGEMLSGGQKQRITIARALIRNPKILILDEATSALDNISEYHVQKAISSSIKGRTTFIVAHRLSTIRNADRILVMENGVCIESGTYNELMEKKGKFFELKNLNDLNTKTAEIGLGEE